ncbi:hypothetical protein [Hyphomonas sp.]|uniref:hypothetical protein n=1 Tax=Hyphomonas sp. TaxID=87 RepID=UPI003918855B
MKRHSLRILAFAASLCLLAPPGLPQGADDGSRCEHRFGELTTLHQRAAESQSALHERMDRIAARLDALSNSGQWVCAEGESEGCVRRNPAMTRNHNESTGLNSAYAAFRAQRRQYNEYLTYFDTVCVKAGHGSWGTGQAPKAWPEQTATEENVEIIRDLLSSESEWLQQAY